jgi:hypothetical protein
MTRLAVIVRLLASLLVHRDMWTYQTASWAPGRAAVVNTGPVWKWWALWGTVTLALGLVTGFFPGSSTRATIDHCYRRLPGNEWTPYETKCTGHWSTAGLTVTGRVHLVSGVSRADRYSIGPTLPGGWYEVSVPDSAREHSAAAVPGAAVVYPALVWLVRVAGLLVVAIWLIVLMGQARDRRLLRAYERELRNR